jgi:RimJ/RimL family protein N-acetyltransferase
MPPPEPQPIEHVELTAGPLQLRPWQEDDVEAYWTALESPGGRLWHGTASLGSREDVRAALQSRRDWTAGDHATWAVVSAGELVGNVSLHLIDRQQAGAEIGYWTVPAARGRGIAARAVDAACRWGFTELALHRIQLFHAVENPASGRVAEKAGFTLEGRLRQSYLYGDGLRHDELLWGRLADDPVPDEG